MTSLTYDEACARATLLADVAYTIDFDLTDERFFGCVTTVSFAAAESGAETFLELSGAEDLSVTLNGATVDADYDGQRIRLAGLATRNVAVVRARLPYVNDGEGMHAFTDPADGERYVVAYLGMDVARKVFACFDQPDLKAPVTTTVRAPQEWTVLANGRATGTDAEGRRTFTTTPPISSYLVVVAAGPWHSRTWEHAGLPFGWHARASLGAELDRDFADLRQVTERCFDLYTSTFSEPYPFDSYDQVLGPGHNWGALETPGCVTFRDEYLPRNEPDEAERVELADVIAHEMAHMWFGDLVTMRWWQDTWLNESFADFMGYRMAGAAGLEASLPNFTLTRKPTAYVADARRSSHPIAEDAEHLVDVDMAFNNFDMITYAKGAAVLLQLVTWLGWDTFVKGTNLYLERHRFGNAELADFLDALDSVTDRDVRAWAQAYLRTTGFDTITVTRDGDTPVLQREGSRPHRFTVAALAGPEVSETRLVDLADAPVRLTGMEGRPVIVNAGDEAYAAVLADAQSWSAVGEQLSRLADPQLRAGVWSAAMTQVRAGRLSVADYLDLVAAQLADEPGPLIFAAVSGQALDVVGRWSDPDEVAEGERVLAAVADRVLAAGDPGRALAATRRWAATSVDIGRLNAALADGAVPGGAPLDPDTRWIMIARLAALGEADGARIDAELRTDTIPARSRGCAAGARGPSRPGGQGGGVGPGRRPARVQPRFPGPGRRALEATSAGAVRPVRAALPRGRTPAGRALAGLRPDRRMGGTAVRDADRRTARLPPAPRCDLRGTGQHRAPTRMERPGRRPRRDAAGARRRCGRGCRRCVVSARAADRLLGPDGRGVRAHLCPQPGPRLPVARAPGHRRGGSRARRRAQDGVARGGGRVRRAGRNPLTSDTPRAYTIHRTPVRLVCG